MARVRLVLLGAMLAASVACGEDGSPTGPSPTAVHSIIPFSIHTGDPAATVAMQSRYPGGVTLAPLEAAKQFGAPIGGMSAGSAWTPPGILLPPGPYDPAVAKGDVPGTGYRDAAGHVYPPNTYEWRGYFRD